ncbi:MAG TPA: TRAP transporter large permease, partial [Brevibacillus sp.]|nr:TRAP transporter large permease [Brevibacillus sp.]
MSVIILLLMLLLIVLGFPVAFAIVISTLVFFLVSPDVTLEVLIQRLITGTQSFPLLAIPFFIITGYLMNASDISRRLIRLVSSVMGSVRGGIGYTNITVNTLMAGMSGSSNADAAVLSKLLVEPMVNRGYNKAFATALTAASALIAPIIPPSIGLIMYGFVAEVSIGKLFMAGILPGIVMAIGLFAVNAYVSKRENISKEMNHFSAQELWSALRDAVLALLIPVIIVGGIRFGIMTPTESGAVAVVYSLLIGIFVYKKVKLKHMREVLRESVLLT